MGLAVVTLSALVLAALLGFRHGPLTAADEARYEALSATIADVALDSPAWEVASEEADGSPEVAATALLLASVAQHESGILESVGTCRVLGPSRAASYFQLESLAGYAREDVCSSPDLAARIAASILVRHRRRCPRCPALALVAAYASGDPGKGSRAAREIVSMWVSASRSAGLTVRPYAAERVAVWQ